VRNIPGGGNFESSLGVSGARNIEAKVNSSDRIIAKSSTCEIAEHKNVLEITTEDAEVCENRDASSDEENCHDPQPEDTAQRAETQDAGNSHLDEHHDHAFTLCTFASFSDADQY
jgi:hypothetical protein